MMGAAAAPPLANFAQAPNVGQLSCASLPANRAWVPANVIQGTGQLSCASLPANVAQPVQHLVMQSAPMFSGAPQVTANVSQMPDSLMNPQLLQMASLLQNPQVLQMASSLLQNPQLLQTANASQVPVMNSACAAPSSNLVLQPDLSSGRPPRAFPRAVTFAGGPASNKSVSVKHRRAAISGMEERIRPTLIYNSSAYVCDLMIFIGCEIVPFMRLSGLGIGSPSRYLTYCAETYRACGRKLRDALPISVDRLRDLAINNGWQPLWDNMYASTHACGKEDIVRTFELRAGIIPAEHLQDDNASATPALQDEAGSSSSQGVAACVVMRGHPTDSARLVKSTSRPGQTSLAPLIKRKAADQLHGTAVRARVQELEDVIHRETRDSITAPAHDPPSTPHSPSAASDHARDDEEAGVAWPDAEDEP